MPAPRLQVLAVIDSLGAGGTERSLAELVLALRESNVRFTVAILQSRGDEGVEWMLRDEEIDVRLLPPRRRVRALRRLIREVEPDVVHSMLFESNLLSRTAMIGSRVPLMTSLVNTSYSSGRPAVDGVAPAKLRAVQIIDAVSGRLAVDHYHAVSEAAGENAVDHLRVSPRRISVVKRGRADPRPHLDPDAGPVVRRTLEIPPADLVVVNVGRHEQQKDHVTLIEAMEPILAERDDVWLLVAGRQGRATSAIVDVLDSTAGADRVRLLGHRGDVAAVLAASDLFVLTSRNEGLPGAVIEAMSMGLPVVASDIGPVREVVEVGQTAVTCPPGDPAAFTSAIRALLDDEAGRHDLGARGRQRFERDFTIASSATAMASLYRDVAAAGPRAATHRSQR